MTTRTVIRGTGLITPIGHSARATWDGLLAGEIIRQNSRVPLNSPEANLDRVTILADIAAREALAKARWGFNELESDRTALVVGTSKGSIDAWLTAPPMVAANSTSDNPPAGRSDPWGLHTIAQVLATDLQLGGGPRLTLSSACATGLHALIRGAMLLSQGHADRVLVVAAESSLHPLLVQSYQRLGVLARQGDRVRPLDEARGGFFVAEAAAAVCLESRVPQVGDVFVDGFAMGSDAAHLTGISPDARTLRRCLARAAARGPMDLIHAHATGTMLNDPIELAAIESIAAHGPPPHLFSHKAAIGHTLGAAGLISVVLNTYMHRHGVVPPNANTTAPLPTKHAIISTPAVMRPVRQSLCVAAGFGGATAVIRLKTA